MSLKDVALLAAIKAFAKGKRWQVACSICGATEVAVDVHDLGRMIFSHIHGSDVGLTISTGARMGP